MKGNFKRGGRFPPRITCEALPPRQSPMGLLCTGSNQGERLGFRNRRWTNGQGDRFCTETLLPLESYARRRPILPKYRRGA